MAESAVKHQPTFRRRCQLQTTYNSLNCMTVILLFVCYISNRTDVSIIFIFYLMRRVII